MGSTPQVISYEYDREGEEECGGGQVSIEALGEDVEIITEHPDEDHRPCPDEGGY